MGLVMSPFLCSWTPPTYKGRKWALGPRASQMVSGARGSPWSHLEGQQLLVWAEIQHQQMSPLYLLVTLYLIGLLLGR